MKNFFLLISSTLLILFSVVPAFAATKTYQVTGPVLDMSPTSITVQKGTEKWEIATAGITVPPTVKVGSKVTIQYSMAATAVTAK